MRRKIISARAVVERDIDTSAFSADPTRWLQDRAADHKLKYLLAHADDGVIWGKLDENNNLVTSHKVAADVSPELRRETLQTARLFSRQGELLIWRDSAAGWQARLIRDVGEGEQPTWQECFDEAHILWGTNPQPLNNGFTLMSDGAQGLQHAVPIVVRPKLDQQGRPVPFDDTSRPLRLHVRHYIDEASSTQNTDAPGADPEGFTRIGASRLRDLTTDLPQEARR